MVKAFYRAIMDGIGDMGVWSVERIVFSIVVIVCAVIMCVIALGIRRDE